MKSGYVYAISTDLYKEKDIYKIGFTDNLERRMKQFNNTRTYDDQFYIVNCWKTVNYMNLETLIHRALADHHVKNELFQCPLDKINDTVRQIFKNDSFFIHYDLIIEEAERYKLKWHYKYKYKYFSIESGGIEIVMNDKSIVDEVKKWISVNDKYNLYRFISSSYFNDLVGFLKDRYGVEDVDELATCMEDMTMSETVVKCDALDIGMSTLRIDDA